MALELTDMRPDELTGGPPARGGRPEEAHSRPAMHGYVRPDWQRHVDIGRACGLDKSRRVGEQCLGRSDLKQDRRRCASRGAQKFLSAPLKPNGGFLIFLLPPQGGPGA
jgi:hypothetical protein